MDEARVWPNGQVTLEFGGLVAKKRLEGKAAAKLRSIVRSLNKNELPAAAQTARTLMGLVKDRDTLFALLPSSGHRSKLRRALNQTAGS